MILVWVYFLTLRWASGVYEQSQPSSYNPVATKSSGSFGKSLTCLHSADWHSGVGEECGAAPELPASLLGSLGCPSLCIVSRDSGKIPGIHVWSGVLGAWTGAMVRSGRKEDVGIRAGEHVMVGTAGEPLAILGSPPGTRILEMGSLVALWALS